MDSYARLDVPMSNQDILWTARRDLILLSSRTVRVLMKFGYVCVCSCENVVARLTISLDGPDLTDFRLILSLTGFAWASGENCLIIIIIIIIIS